MRFSDIPGHSEIKENLLTLVKTGRIPHAILVSGPEGSGKMMLARAFAQYLHCESPRNGEPCGECRNCRLHENLTHPDLHFVYPIVKSEKPKRHVSADMAEQWLRMLTENPTMPTEKWLEIIEAKNSQPQIYVEEADEIVRADSYPPMSTPYKIFIIWQPERMTVETANKLLKVVEEPSDDTLFIFVCDDELQLLSTIFSRVQRFQAGRLSDMEIRSYLEQAHGIPTHQADKIAQTCNGSLIRADEAATHSGENEEFLALYQEIMRSAYGKRVAKLRQLSDSIGGYGREKIRRFLFYMAYMIRENFIYNMKQPLLITMTPEEEAFSTKFSPFVNHLNVEDFAAETDRARRDIERNANPRLVLFDYFILCIILLHRKEKK